MEEWQETFTKAFNSGFGPPFLPEGFAKVDIIQYKRPKPMQVIRISIGDREVDFSVDGKGQDSGTSVGCGTQWQIYQKER